MATGTAPQLPRDLPMRVSSTLGLGVDPPASQGVYAVVALGDGGPATPGVPDPVGGVFVGQANTMFEGLFYGRVHVTPPSIAAGFVLSTQEHEVELWNSRPFADVLTGVDLGSAGGLVLVGFPSLPAHFPHMGTAVFTLQVTTDGSPQIDDVIVYDFDSGPVEQPIEGSRLVVFPISPDWARSLEEGFGHLTDVLVAYDNSEQRIQLREVPTRSLSFTAMAERPRDASLLHAILYDWQARLYGVPWWMDIAKLDAPLGVGETEIFVETAYRAFEAGGLVLVWRDAATWEAFEVDSVAADRVVVTSPAQASWSASGGVWVMPLRVGRLEDVVALIRHSQESAEAGVIFEVDTV